MAKKKQKKTEEPPKKKMKVIVISDFDGNESFEAEGDTMEECYLDALSQLNWSVTELNTDILEEEE